jgi:hypothetical protein
VVVVVPDLLVSVGVAQAVLVVLVVAVMVVPVGETEALEQ